MYSRRAVELNDKDPYALMSLAASLVETGAYDEALHYYKKSKDLDSSRANIYSEMAYLYELESKYEEAEQCHKKAIELDPDSHLTHYYLGAFYHAMARYDEAIIEIKKALEYSPGDIVIMHALGSCYWGMGSLDEATSIFEEIIAIDSAQGRVLSNMGSIYFYKGDFDQSIEYFKKAEKYIPQSHNLYASLGKSYYWKGQKLKAHEAINKAVSMVKNSSPESFLTLATYYAIMDMADSSEYYLEAYTPPDHPDELEASEAFVLGELYLTMGRDSEAFKFISSGLKRGYGWLDVRHSPIYKNLAQNIEFQEMIARAEEAQK